MMHLTQLTVDIIDYSEVEKLRLSDIARRAYLLPKRRSFGGMSASTSDSGTRPTASSDTRSPSEHGSQGSRGFPSEAFWTTTAKLRDG